MKIKRMFSVVLLVLVGCSPLPIELEIDVNPNPAKVGEEVSIIVHEPEEAKGEFSTVGVMVMISWTDPETGSTTMQAFQDKQFEEEMIFVPDVPVPHSILASSYSLTKQAMGFVTLTVNE